MKISLYKYHWKIGLCKFDYQDTVSRIGIIFYEVDSENGFTKSTDDKSKVLRDNGLNYFI